MDPWKSQQGTAYEERPDWEPARALSSRERRALRRASDGIGVLGVGILVALVCVSALIGLSWIQAQGAVDVVRAQAKAIQEGDFAQAYTFFSSSYRADMSLPMFRRWLRRQASLVGIHDLSIWGRSVWRGTAILRGSFLDEEGRRQPVRYSLVRENGVWRIDGLQVPETAPEPLPNDDRFNYI